MRTSVCPVDKDRRARKPSTRRTPPPSVDGDVPSSADANPQLKTATLTLESRTMMARKLIGQTIGRASPLRLRLACPTLTLAFGARAPVISWPPL